jgi:hypothetical protein
MAFELTVSLIGRADPVRLRLLVHMDCQTKTFQIREAEFLSYGASEKQN